MAGIQRKLWTGSLIVALLLAASVSGFAQVGLGDCTKKPISIKSSGSYVLKHNVASKSGKDCIDVLASNVTIDLNGFAILSGLVGINAANKTYISIRNGMVTGMTGPGIVVGGYSTVQGVHSNLNAGDGILCEGDGCVISDNSADGNQNNGIEVTGNYARISGNTANGNTNSGILAGSGSSGQSNIITGNTANGNASNAGIQCGYNAIVNGNTTDANGGDGINCGTGSTIDGNIASLNHGSGISTGDNVRIGANVLNDNSSDGIRTGTALVQGNETNGNGGYGLNTSSVGTGFTENVFNSDSSGAVRNGVSLGNNVCDGTKC